MSVWAGLTPTNMHFVILEIIVLFCPSLKYYYVTYFTTLVCDFLLLCFD